MSSRPRLAHQMPGRLRFVLPRHCEPDELKAVIADIKSSPHVQKVVVRCRSLTIEHTAEASGRKDIGSVLNRVFPGYDQLSDDLDEKAAKKAADPTLNKLVPLCFLGLAGWKILRDGAFIAGESAFAIAYLAFDVYWKLQQENLIKKLEKGMSQGDMQVMASQAAQAGSQDGRTRKRAS